MFFPRLKVHSNSIENIKEHKNFATVKFQCNQQVETQEGKMSGLHCALGESYIDIEIYLGYESLNDRIC